MRNVSRRGDSAIPATILRCRASSHEMPQHIFKTTAHRWSVERPNVLVIACSDGRLQEMTDDFLGDDLGIKRYDRFYAPGGAGALASTGRDFSRARVMRQECRYLIDLHHVGRAILLFHGPA